MPSIVLCTLLALQIPFPRPNAGSESRPVHDESWITGRVRTKGGEPIPVGTISVQSRGDVARADQRESAAGWPGTVTRLKTDGSFRIAVPGGSTMEVCAAVPGKPKQCRTVDVNPNDLEVLEFTF